MAFTDDFSGEASDVDLASHTPSGGTSWTRTGTANALEASSGGECLASGASAIYICDDQGSADQYALATLVTRSSSYAGAFVACRIVDADNFIGWRLAGVGVSGSRLSKRVSGVTTDLVLFQGNAASVYKVECSGSDVKIYEDGVQKGTTQTVTDGQTETSQGLVNQGSSSASGWIDDFEAGALGGAATNPKGPLGHPLHGPFGGPL